MKGGCAGYAAGFGAEVSTLHTSYKSARYTHTHTGTGTNAPTHITSLPEIILLRIASIAHLFGACVAVHIQTHTLTPPPHTHL